jgi:hypothetical protein
MNLMVDEMAELVQEADRDATADPRYAQVDRILLPIPVRARFADRRRRSHGNGLEIGTQRMQLRRGSQRTLKLRRQRTATRKCNDFLEVPQPRLAFSSNATGVSALSHV